MENFREIMFRIYISLLICTLPGCFSDDDRTNTVDTSVEGIFIDSAVEGISYTSDSVSGLTGRWGEFQYVPGETVTFSIADILLGETVGTQKVTPVDLVSATSTNADIRITNIAWLLQMLDSDAKPVNGITISGDARLAASGQSLDLDLPNEEFARSMVTQSFLRASGSPGLQADLRPAKARLHLSEGLAGFLPYKSIDQGTMSGITTEQQLVIDNQTSWENFWLKHNGNSPPEVDFSREIVLAASLGEQANSGYWIDISSIRDTGEEIVVNVYSHNPAPNEVTAAKPVQPYVIVKTKQWGKPVRFDLDLSDNTILSEKDSCLIDGGLFRQFGFIAGNRCNRRTRDAGTACTGLSQCESVCFGATEADGQLSGSCYEWSIAVGCFEGAFISEKEIGTLCID